MFSPSVPAVRRHLVAAGERAQLVYLVHHSLFAVMRAELRYPGSLHPKARGPGASVLSTPRHAAEVHHPLPLVITAELCLVAILHAKGLRLGATWFGTSPCCCQACGFLCVRGVRCLPVEMFCPERLLVPP